MPRTKKTDLREELDLEVGYDERLKECMRGRRCLLLLLLLLLLLPIDVSLLPHLIFAQRWKSSSLDIKVREGWWAPMVSHNASKAIPENVIERAIQCYSNSRIAKTTAKPRRRFPDPPRPDGNALLASSEKVDTVIESRLKQLRQSFSQRAEKVRKRELMPKEEEQIGRNDEETTDAEGSTTRTESFLSSLDLGTAEDEKKIARCHKPSRYLHIQRPSCLIPLSPNKVPFLKVDDARPFYLVVIDDGGNLVPSQNEAEVLGLPMDVSTTWRFRLPSWLPLPSDFVKATIEPTGLFYIIWLFFVMLAFIYNGVAIPFREAFDIYDRAEDQNLWLTCDSVADAIYLADLIIIKPRIQFIENGFFTVDFKRCAKHYLKQLNFKLDVASVIPFDLLGLIHAKPTARYRILRFLKYPVMLEFFDRTDLRVSAGFAVRLAKAVVYLIYVIHVESCGYYAFNRFHGLNASNWSIGNQNNNPYIYSFYLATKMATSIGNLPHATNSPEFIFMTVYWLTGVYISAILIGQVIDILDSKNAEKEAYKKLMNATLTYLKRIRAPEKDIDMVRTWFNHNWRQQKTLDENMLIDALPLKLKKDVLIDVHYKTLSKVSLFKNCEKTMIFDLVCKLKPVLFLPGALICEKGEVGMDMYIVKQGFVEVVGGPDNSIVYATLREGSVFGEISLLALKGKNIRTATVRSKGYSTLFRLTKSDFEEAMKNYPTAYNHLKRKAQKMLTKDKKKVDEEMRAIEVKEAKGVGDNGPIGSIEIIPDCRKLPKMSMAVDQVMERMRRWKLQNVKGSEVKPNDEATSSQNLSNWREESDASIDSEGDL
ncbi:Cyclic nucleotide-gated cation channel beta-3 [Taenia crassiceps]|uniref:Cyclic nucleotide-gated cation channel beta-3 n=1 Tax=Taenia crassiceps TaxID=6207 RepID=A0ABR4Q710_9CEST